MLVHKITSYNNKHEHKISAFFSFISHNILISGHLTGCGGADSHILLTSFIQHEKTFFSALRSYSRTTHSFFAFKRRKPNRFMGATQLSHINNNYTCRRVCCTPAVYTVLLKIFKPLGSLP